MTYENENVNLEEYDEKYQAAEEPEEREFEPVPDGKYQVNVNRAEITTAKTSGNPMLKWTLKIIAPKYSGRLLWNHHILSNSTSLSWLKKDLKMCGITLDKLSALSDKLNDLVGLKLEVSAKTREGSTSVYFNRLLSDAEVQTLEDDSDIPF